MSIRKAETFGMFTGFIVKSYGLSVMYLQYVDDTLYIL
jgi:hypothetical protein